MDTILGILGVIAFFAVSIWFKIWREDRKARKIASNLKSNIETCLDICRSIGIDDYIEREGTNSAKWKDCFVIFALLMFLDQTVRAVGKVTKDDAACIELYMACCRDSVKGMLSDGGLIEKLEDVTKPVLELEDNGDVEHIQQVYKTAFSKALNISVDSKLTNFSLNLLAKQFGTWI